MLIDMDLTSVPTSSLKRIQSSMVDIVAAAVRLSGKNVGVCGMVDSLLECSD
jgi:hypothetical protein